MAYEDYHAVIGLEIHAQLKTESKMFCRCSSEFGKADNENSCPVCAGMPGALPVLNKKALEYAVKTGLALNAQVNLSSVFARKNYFYPDMPKGYQISQYDQPIVGEGWVGIKVEGMRKKIRIERAHLEEDAGKSTHHGDHTLINLNRAGTPLLEIVTKPDMNTPAEAAEYAREIRKILRYLDVCDGNLEEGSLRCDCNISVKKKSETELGTKVEIKNINSFRFVEKALQYEIERQIDMVESGDRIIQETRLFDIDKNKTFSMRTKEDAEDYRYFPEPDLPMARVTERQFEQWKAQMPELPRAKAGRFQEEFSLSEDDALALTQEQDLALYFEETVKVSGNAKLACNWITSELAFYLKEHKLDITDSPIKPNQLGELIQQIDKNVISGKIAKTVLEKMWAAGVVSQGNHENPDKQPVSAKDIINKEGLAQITDQGEIEKMVDQVLTDNPAQVQQFLDGKEKVLGFFVGQIMKASRGKANPDVVNQLLRDKINKK